MDIQTRFIKIREFLQEHLELLNQEPLEQYSTLLKKGTKYLTWANSLENWSDQEIIDLENNKSITNISNSELRVFIEEIKYLCTLPQLLPHETAEIPSHLKRKMTLKKVHEVKTIKSQLDALNIQNFIDIGSGAAHLSSALLYKNNKKSSCIDLNSKYQAIGKKKLERYDKDISKRIHFLNLDFSISSSLSSSNLVYSETSYIGLHACGNLSVEIIKHYSKSDVRFLLNYACCFHKLTNEFMNISVLSKDLSELRLTNHALTLASKSYNDLTVEALKYRRKVKAYRYLIHILCKEKMGKGFMTLGNGNKNDYNGHFSNYVKKHLNTTKHNLSNVFLEEFKDKNISSVLELQRIDIIRSLLARMVEVYINLDRAIYLEEQGHKVEIGVSFDPSISPRNVYLLAY